jgi:hypothetical protein
VPSNKKQINVRVSAAAVERLARVVESMSAVVGFAVSQADAIEAALVELEKKYPPAGSPPPAQKPSRTRKGKG